MPPPLMRLACRMIDLFDFWQVLSHHMQKHPCGATTSHRRQLSVHGNARERQSELLAEDTVAILSRPWWLDDYFSESGVKKSDCDDFQEIVREGPR